MNGFRTSRALIIDDEIIEAMPIVRALGLLGISSIYHDAHPDRDYSTKHAGVRLLVLDMVLGERVADANNPKDVASGLIGALRQILDPSPGLLVAVCWTKHKENVDEFVKAFATEFPYIQLADVLVLEKTDVEDPAKSESLVQGIRDAMSRYEPATLLLGWEQLVHEAATKTTSNICELAATHAATEKTSWSDGAYAVCAALALAERGARLTTEGPDFALRGLTDALGPLLLDRIEHATPDVPKEVAALLFETAGREVDQWVNSTSLLRTDLRAILNSKVNISYNVTKGEVCPGNVYVLPWKGENYAATQPYFSEWPEVKADTFCFKPGEKLAPGHFPVLVEITPPCDFAQGKGKVPRFVTGFLIPESSTAPIREEAAYVRRVSIFQLNTLDINGVHSLAINCHYIVSFPRAITQKLHPSFRLRSAIAADVVAWIGAHMSRPGFVQLVPALAQHAHCVAQEAAAEPSDQK